jgi:hypothetical protein
MRELGIDADRIAEGFGPRLDGLDARDLDDAPPTPEAHAAMWGNWAGREEAFYAASYDLVRGLDRTRFEALVGIEHAVAVDRLGRRHDAITNPTLPDPLVRNPALRVDRMADGSCVLTVGDTGESTRLRGELYRLLALFDGRRPTRDIRGTVKAQTGVGVADSFLIALHQHRILIAAHT